MNHDLTIVKELKEISAVVAELPRQNPVSGAPDGYFDQFADNLMRRINAFSVTEELQGLSPLVNDLSKKPVFILPENYFDQLPDAIMFQINQRNAITAAEEIATLSPLLGQLGKPNPFAAPAGYFDELADNLAGGAKALDLVNDELENFSPLMTALRNENTYVVPAGYFDAFADSVKQRINAEKPKAKIISLPARNWMKFAAAAALTGVLLTIGYFTFNRQHTTITDPVVAIAKLSDQEMVNYLQLHDLPTFDSTNVSTASIVWTDNDARDLFEGIPDAELEQYVADDLDGKDIITN